jgi:peptidoglycan hydrolase CwlO-like protein
MAKIIFQISYDVIPEQREEFLTVLKELKEHIVNVRKKKYIVFENKSKKNSFVEQYMCDSETEFDALEDDLDERSEELTDKVQSMLVGGKTKYSTLIESE